MMVKMIKQKVKLSLNMMGEVDANLSDVTTQATEFAAACNGQSKARSVSEA